MALMSSIVSVGVGVTVGIGGTGGIAKVGIAESVGTTLAAGAHETKAEKTSKTITVFLILIRTLLCKKLPDDLCYWRGERGQCLRVTPQRRIALLYEKKPSLRARRSVPGVAIQPARRLLRRAKNALLAVTQKGEFLGAGKTRSHKNAQQMLRDPHRTVHAIRAA